jgi:hypothetical protein
MKHIVMTYEDFKDKEENWPGIIYALSTLDLTAMKWRKD